MFVTYPAIQGRCSSCDCYHTVKPAEIHPTRKATWRLMRYVSLLARFVPMDAMKGICSVPAATAWRYDKDVLERDLPEPNLDGLKAILVDEKSIGRGHQYITLVLNAKTGELLHLHEGKKRESLGAFFDKLTEEQKQSIKAVCIDRAGSYMSAVKQWLPKAEIVFDRFHLMQNLGKAIDEVRRQEHREASEEDRKVIKGSRYNLLRNSENLPEDKEADLHKLLDINENLNIAYILKEQFRITWTYCYAANSKRFLMGWVEQVRESGIEPLIKFANGIERDIEGIVSWCRHYLTNGPIEGFNSIVSRILFKARGIR